MPHTEYTPAEIEQFYKVVLDGYGLHHMKGFEYRSCCPFSGGDNPSSLLTHMDTGAYHCFSCPSKGSNIFSFAQDFLRQNSKSGQAPEHGVVKQWIHEILGTPFTERVYPESVAKVKASGKGWDRAKAQDSYVYTDELEWELYTAWKFVDGEGNKELPVDHPCPCSRDPKANPKPPCEAKCFKGRVWGAKGIRRVLYHLLDVLQCLLVFIVEGEKDVNNLCRALAAYISKHGGFRLGKLILDRVAVCTNPGGSSGWKPEYGYGKFFTGKIVVKLGDNDVAGRLHDEAVCKDVCNFASKLFTLALPVGESEDISDFIKQRGATAIDDLIKLLESDRKPYAVAATQGATVGDSILTPRVILVHPVELGNKTDIEGDYIVDGIFERGQRGLVVAPPKVGKSLLFLDLAVALASMTRFLGARPYWRPVRSAIISREDGPALVRRRLAQLAAGRNLTLQDINPFIHVNTVKQSSSFHIDSQKDLEEMAQWLKAAEVEFCILDVLNRLHLKKENDTDDMTRVMKKFDELSELSGSQVCVIHHLSRAGNVKGATPIEAWADFICKLEADATDESLKTISIRTKASGLIQPRTVRYWQSDDKTQSRILLVTKIEKGGSDETKSSFKAGSVGGRVM